MIKFGLICDSEHEFDAWFSSSDNFGKQRKRGLVTCPHCNSAKVDKSLMAPSVSTARRKEKMRVSLPDSTIATAQQAAMAEMRKLRDTILNNSENVGKQFPDEARKIHYGESEQRGIYGEASLDDARSLLDEGIDLLPIPVLPEDSN